MNRTVLFWVDVWTESWNEATRLSETLVAAPAVVSSRLTMLDPIWRDPDSNAHAELYSMVAEKIEAVALAAMSLGRDWQAIQAELISLPRSTEAAVESSMLIGRLASGAIGRAMTPVHARVLENVRRLRRSD